MYKGYKKWSSSLDIHLLGPSSIPMTLGPGLLSTYHLHPKQARAESHGNGVRTKQQCVCKANFFYIFISPLSLSFSFFVSPLPFISFLLPHLFLPAGVKVAVFPPHRWRGNEHSLDSIPCLCGPMGVCGKQGRTESCGN